MFEFKHPKYYTELRKRNKELQAATRDLAGAQSDQAISDEASTEATSVRPDPGHKQQATSKQEGASNQQSTSSKAQATSLKP
jgi:Skp family chaperone for outer membrane proteins